MFWPYMAPLAPRYVVYFVVDAFSLAPGWSDEQAEFEARLVERADLIAGASREMLDCLPGQGPSRGRELPHGVDVDAFAAARTAPAPADLEKIPHPRIGYVGRINQKLDIGLVEALAIQDPGKQWVFIGPVIEAGAKGEFAGIWQRCLALPNFHYLGPKAHSDVPRYMRHMDVNVMCYRTNDGWQTVGYPIKMHEYFAVGRPVVSADLSTVRPFARVLDIARTREEWPAAIDRALHHGGVGTPEARLEVAKQNSWDARVDQLDAWLLDMISESAPLLPAK
jgi:glycosyltransferase involved in cell wall biosynthesis